MNSAGWIFLARFTNYVPVPCVIDGIAINSMTSGEVMELSLFVV